MCRNLFRVDENNQHLSYKVDGVSVFIRIPFGYYDLASLRMEFLMKCEVAHMRHNVANSYRLIELNLWQPRHDEWQYEIRKSDRITNLRGSFIDSLAKKPERIHFSYDYIGTYYAKRDSLTYDGLPIHIAPLTYTAFFPKSLGKPLRSRIDIQPYIQETNGQLTIDLSAVRSALIAPTNTEPIELRIGAECAAAWRRSDIQLEKAKLPVLTCKHDSYVELVYGILLIMIIAIALLLLVIVV